MRSDPCPACSSRIRLTMTVTVDDMEAFVDVCWGCHYPHDVAFILDEYGLELHPTRSEETDALDEATLLLTDHGERSVWLRRMRDYACLRWSCTADRRWLDLAHRLELSRRKSVEPLRLVRDIDRVEIAR